MNTQTRGNAVKVISQHSNKKQSKCDTPRLRRQWPPRILKKRTVQKNQKFAKVIEFLDPEGNEITLSYDDQKGWAVSVSSSSFDAQNIVTDGKIELFTLTGDIQASDKDGTVVVSDGEISEKDRQRVIEEITTIAQYEKENKLHPPNCSRQALNAPPRLLNQRPAQKKQEPNRKEFELNPEAREFVPPDANKIAEAVEKCSTKHPQYQEEKLRLHEKSSNAVNFNRMSVTEEKYVEEYKIKPHRQEKQPRLYKKSSKAFNTRNDVKCVDNLRKVINFDSRESKKKYNIHPLAKNSFIQKIELKLENIDTILCEIDSLKPAQLKEYLKEFLREEDFRRNWNKTVLQKKLKRYLNDKRQSIVTEKEKTQTAIDLGVQKLTSSFTLEGTIHSSKFLGQIWNYHLEEFPVVLNYGGKMFVLKRICRNVVSFKCENQTEIHFEYKTTGTDIVDAVCVAKIQNCSDLGILHQPKANLILEVSRIFETVLKQQIAPKEINLSDIEIFTASMKTIRAVKNFLRIENRKTCELNYVSFNEGAQKEQETG